MIPPNVIADIVAREHGTGSMRDRLSRRPNYVEGLPPRGVALLNACHAVVNGDHARWPELSKELVRQFPNMTIDEFMQNVGEAVLRVADRAHVDASLLAAETMPFAAALFMWERDGRPSFALQPDFFQAVSLTDFGEPSEEPMYMPFDSFVMSWPKSDRFGGSNRMFVYKVPTVLASGGKLNVSWNMMRMTVLSDDPVFSQWRIGMSRAEMHAYVTEADKGTVPGARPVEDGERDVLRDTRRLLANVLTYIEAAGPLPKKRVKGGAPAPVERTHDTRPVFDVGRVVKLDRGIREALTHGGHHNTWQLDKRFIVRGHFRNQAVGVGRASHKRIWIQPFWKGPDAVEALSRLYEVK